MKSLLKVITICIACMAVAIGCSDDNSAFKYPDSTVDPDGIIDRNSNGYLSLRSFYLCVETETESLKDNKGGTVAMTKAVDETIDISAYTVEITKESTNEVVYKDTYANTKGMESYLTLRAGAYNVSVYSCTEREIEGAAWDSPEYSGTKRYVVGDEKVTTVGEVTCTMSNLMASVEMSKDLIDKFDPSPEDDDYKLQIIISVGGNELSFDPTMAEPQKGYFKVPSNGKMIVYLVGMYNTQKDPDVTPTYMTIAKGDWSQGINDVKAGQYRNVAVKIDYNEQGSIQIGVTVESWTYDETITVAVMNKLLYTLAEDVIFDPDSEFTMEDSPVVALDNGLNIEDIYYISPAILDTATETYAPTYRANITPNDDSTVETIKLKIESTSSDLMAKLAEYGFIEGEYFTMYEGGQFVTSDSFGNFISLADNGSAVVAALKYRTIVDLCDYIGVHTIKVMAVDSKDRASFTTLTLESKPLLTGLEPSVTWNDYIDSNGEIFSYDITKRYEIFEDEARNATFNFSIISQHEEGIKSLFVEIDSEALTPEILESVGLVAKMDLVNATGSILESLKKLELPTGDDVYGQSNVNVDITKFMPLLAILPAGKSDFKIIVSDEHGTTTPVIMVEKK